MKAERWGSEGTGLCFPAKHEKQVQSKEKVMKRQGKLGKKRIGLRWAALGVMLAAGILTAGCNGRVPADSAPASSDVSDAAPVEEVTWNNRFFIATQTGLGAINTPAQVTRVMENYAEAGINMAMWWTQESLHSSLFLELCEKYGIYALLMDNETISGASENWKPVTEDTFRSVMEQYRDNPYVLGFVNWDEPFHEDAYYSMMKQRQDWTQQYAPGKMSFINLAPSYGPYTWGNGLFREQVDTLMSRVDPQVLAVDYYAFSVYASGNAQIDLNACGLWRDLGYLRQQAMASGKPLWFYFQGFDNLPAAHIRFQMNAGLAYGCRWLCYWTTESSIVDERGFKSRIFEEVKAINADVMTVGNYLFDKQPDRLYQTGLNASAGVAKALEKIYYTDDAAESDVFAALPSGHAIVSTFRDGTDRLYAVVVNRHCYESLNDSLTLKSPRRISELRLSDGTEQPVSDSADVISLRLGPGELALYILE